MNGDIDHILGVGVPLPPVAEGGPTSAAPVAGRDPGPGSATSACGRNPVAEGGPTSVSPVAGHDPGPGSATWERQRETNLYDRYISYDAKPDTRAFWFGKLPHWDVLGRPIFVTLHVQGAIPAEVADAIHSDAAQLSERGDTDFTRRLKLIFSNMEAWLDRQDQPPLLTEPRVAALLREAMAERERRGEWRLLEWTIMPSHLHILYVGGAVGMRPMLTGLKQWTGRQAGSLLKRDGQRFWQTEWFDHWSRSAAETERIVEYIRQNPVRAGLVAEWQAWPHRGGDRP